MSVLQANFLLFVTSNRIKVANGFDLRVLGRYLTPLFFQNFRFLIFLFRKNLQFFMGDKSVLASCLTLPSVSCPAPPLCLHPLLLTPWCRVLLEKLPGFQSVKKFLAFHGIRRFITALTSPRHLSLSWASPIQSIHAHPTSWRSILILSTHLRLGLPSVSLG